MAVVCNLFQSSFHIDLVIPVLCQNIQPVFIEKEDRKSKPKTENMLKNVKFLLEFDPVELKEEDVFDDYYWCLKILFIMMSEVRKVKKIRSANNEEEAYRVFIPSIDEPGDFNSTMLHCKKISKQLT